MLLQLCIRPTPVHRWDIPGAPKDFQLFIKRDDMTGSTLSGNKVTCTPCTSGNSYSTDRAISGSFVSYKDSKARVPDGRCSS